MQLNGSRKFKTAHRLRGEFFNVHHHAYTLYWPASPTRPDARASRIPRAHNQADRALRRRWHNRHSRAHHRAETLRRLEAAGCRRKPRRSERQHRLGYRCQG